MPFHVCQHVLVILEGVQFYDVRARGVRVRDHDHGQLQCARRRTCLRFEDGIVRDGVGGD